MHFSIYGFEVPPWIFGLGALGGFAWEVGRLWLAIRSDFWPYVIGTIKQAVVEVRSDSDGDEYFVPVVQYVYNVAGETYVGKRLSFTYKRSSRHKSAADALSGVEVSLKRRVYYHPRYPQLSVLKPGGRLLNYIVILALFATAGFAAFAQISLSHA